MPVSDPVVIVEAKRTPTGNFLGNFSSLSCIDLGAMALQGVMQSLPEGLSVDDVLMGCVLPAGLGQAPARQAALKAGLPDSVRCATVNKVCGSGMYTVMMGAHALLAESAQVVMAGGMESMTNAPYMVPKVRQGHRLGHTSFLDHMMFDGLEDAYHPNCAMGKMADALAQELNISKKQQDDYAYHSALKAWKAQESGVFESEIIPVTVQDKKEIKTIHKDELPAQDKLEKIPHLKGIYGPESTITAANASSISDGAAALVLVRQRFAEKNHLDIKGIIRGYHSHAQNPSTFPTAPIGALKKLSEKIGWPLDSVDFFEINEAFAMVVLATLQALSIPLEKVNIYGGACALGHPIGASGSRILVTLLNVLKRQKKARGMATLCIGGGEATALAIEMPL